LLLAAGAALVVVLGAAAPGGAQSELEEREQVQQQQAEAAAQLEVVTAQDAELEAALTALSDQVRTQEALVEATQQAVQAATAEVAAAEAEVEEQQARIDELRTEVQATAVEAYIDPATDVLAQVLASEDLNEAARREALIGNAVTRQQDLLDEMRATEEDLAMSQQQAEDARVRVEEEQEAAEAQLAELEETKAEQQRLEEALDQRIADFQAEIDALQASEAELTAIINARASTSSGGGGGGPGGSSSAGPGPGGLVWPTDGPVTSPFGQRWGRLHAGIDIGAPSGQPIYAAAAGTVIMGCGSGYGNCVLIDHGGGFITLYAHQTSIFVGDGQSVTQGQNIGTVGCTGSCTGPHLHFETRVNGSPQNPMGYF